METHLINILPNTMVDDFAIFGFLGGMVGYAWYLFTNRKDPKNHMNVFVGIYGVFLSGCLGALLAIAVDRSIALSIVVGLVNQVLYIAIVRSVKNKNFLAGLRQILINLLTGGIKK